MAIETGLVREHGSGVWQIVDSVGTLLAKFNRSAFPHASAGSTVYFTRMRDNKDYCRNVQPILLVDDRVGLARPSQGFDGTAESILRGYIMNRLYEVTGLNGSARADGFRALDARMAAVKAAAEATPLKKVTAEVLAGLGIA